MSGDAVTDSLDTLDEGLGQVFDQLLGGPTDDPPTEDDPPPEGEEPEDDTGAEDEAGIGDEDSEEVSEEEVSGGDDDDEDEDEDEDEDDEEDEDEDDEEEKDDFLTVTAEERAAIEAHPTLKKLHRSMQADYTRKTQAVSERESRIERIESMMRDPEQSASFLAGVYGRMPMAAAEALSKIAVGENAQDFLVAVGVRDPKIFEQAADRVRDIVDDPDELKKYNDDQRRTQEDQRLAHRESVLRQQRFDDDMEKIQSAADREAQKLSFDADELAGVQERLRELVKARVNRDTGSVALSGKEVRKLLKDERKRLDRIYEKAQAKARRRLAKDSQNATKRKAEQASQKVPAGPGTAPRRAPKDKPPRFKPPEDGDGLDAYIDFRFQ